MAGVFATTTQAVIPGISQNQELFSAPVTVTLNASDAVQANGSYSFTLTLPATKNGSDKNGHLYTIVVTASDQAGNSRPATTTLTIN